MSKIKKKNSNFKMVMIDKNDHQLLSKIAQQERRAMKTVFSMALEKYASSGKSQNDQAA